MENHFSVLFQEEETLPRLEMRGLDSLCPLPMLAMALSRSCYDKLSAVATYAWCANSAGYAVCVVLWSDQRIFADKEEGAGPTSDLLDTVYMRGDKGRKLERIGKLHQNVCGQHSAIS